MKVLWLCSWYPNKLKPFDGDFIQRHAQAVSLLHEIHTIHIVKNEAHTLLELVPEETTTTGNLTETVIYYRPVKTGISLLDRLLSAKKYNQLFRSATTKYLLANEDCKLIHVHVAMKAGMIALWAKRKYGIPYIISEHWTGFLPEAKPNINHRSIHWKRRLRKVLDNANLITCVSHVLATAIKHYGNRAKIEVVPNVVDTNIFYPVGKLAHDATQFIHISTMTYQKNVETILEAAYTVKKSNRHFILRLFVPTLDEIKMLIKKHKLEDVVEVHMEVNQSDLAKFIQQSDALILYSRYETFGCVVIEANACGVPAILSDLEVFKEYCVNGFNAIMVPGDDAKELSKSMISFIDHQWHFDSKAIARTTSERFSYKVIAGKFDDIYHRIGLLN